MTAYHNASTCQHCGAELDVEDGQTECENDDCPRLWEVVGRRHPDHPELWAVADANLQKINASFARADLLMEARSEARSFGLTCA